MENPTNTGSKKILLPALIGAAAAGVIAYFLCSDELKELRTGLSGRLAKKWDTLKEKVSEKPGNQSSA